MQILLKQVKIIDPTSPHHGQVRDILVKDGKIASIRKNISSAGRSFQIENAMVSPGWMDVGTWIGDPGFEQVEVLQTASQAASRGGFTSLVMLPNTAPVMDNKGSIEYVKNQSRPLLTNVYAAGALSQGCQGIELAELMDMHSAGAIAFTDGTASVQHSGLLLKALEYVKIFGGLIMNSPMSSDLSTEGQIHEGEVSVALGLRGITGLSEVLMLKRDIDLLRYTGSKLFVSNVSTAESVNHIRAAKQEGLQIFCSVPALNLLCTDEQVSTFNVNYKVMPPLRSELDRKALLGGLKDGTIDCVASNHRPVDVEHKNLEFAYADFGISNLETAFQIMIKALGKKTNLSKLVNCLAIKPRKILGLAIPSIKRGNLAELTLFSTDETQKLTTSQMHSRSSNNPFLDETLPGKVYGVMANDHCQLFD